MQGQNDPNYDDIIKSITSIIFLSTPHRGTNLAEILNRILQISFVTNPMKFIAELAAGSQTLQRLNEQFRHVAPNLQIISFYETRPTPVLKKTQVACSSYRSYKRYLTLLTDGFGEGLLDSRISGRSIKTSRRGPSRCLQVR